LTKTLPSQSQSMVLSTPEHFFLTKTLPSWPPGHGHVLRVLMIMSCVDGCACVDDHVLCLVSGRPCLAFVDDNVLCCGFKLH